MIAGTATSRAVTVVSPPIVRTEFTINGRVTGYANVMRGTSFLWCLFNKRGLSMLVIELDERQLLATNRRFHDFPVSEPFGWHGQPIPSEIRAEVPAACGSVDSFAVGCVVNVTFGYTGLLNQRFEGACPLEVRNIRIAECP